METIGPSDSSTRGKGRGREESEQSAVGLAKLGSTGDRRRPFRLKSIGDPLLAKGSVTSLPHGLLGVGKKAVDSTCSSTTENVEGAVGIRAAIGFWHGRNDLPDGGILRFAEIGQAGQARRQKAFLLGGEVHRPGDMKGGTTSELEIRIIE